MAKILVLDDDLEFAFILRELLEEDGDDVVVAHTIQEARQALLSKEGFDLALIDLVLPDGSGLDLIPDFGARPHPKFMVLTGHASLDTAVEALRHHVLDYISKPLDVDQFRATLEAFRGREHLPARARKPASAHTGLSPSQKRLGPIFGDSPAMRRIYSLVERVAPSDTTVLIQGESGTGKELVATTIHQLSKRSQGPFIAVNCGGIAESLIASELFGHERGSFTGANRQHRGCFERAEGGTLFLDEITEMSLDLQAHLLRALETRKVVRVGGDHEIDVDVRILAATNRQPEQAVRDGKLREDLFFRLQVFPIRLPSLRERGSDVVLLAEHFLNLFNTTHGTLKHFSPIAIDSLKHYSWPGNVRELRNAVERACLLSEVVIEPDHLLLDHVPAPPLAASMPGATVDVSGVPIRAMEQQLIMATLKECNGNKRLAAERLGISLKTLYNKLKTYEEPRNGAMYEEC